MRKSLARKPSAMLPVVVLLTGAVVQAGAAANATAGASLPGAQLPFIENLGQVSAAEVAFYANTFGGSVFVNYSGEWRYHLPATPDTASERTGAGTWAFSERLLNAAKTRPVGESPAAAIVSYFKGDADQWRTDIGSYRSIAFNDIYPGVRLRLNARGNNVEKLFYVAPYADADRIRLQIDGVERLATNQRQQLVLETDLGNIVFTAPKAFQNIGGRRVDVDVAYVVDDNQYGFSLGAYDRAYELIIDPLLASTFIGGDNTNAISDFERIHDVVERDGYVFVAGVTDSGNYPATLGYNTSYNGGFYDGFVSKFDADLTTLVASTFIGGASIDDIYGMALDDVGSVYVLGRTGGAGFPLTAGGYRYNANATGGTFVAKLNNDLNILYATALAAGSSLPSDIAIGNGSVYLSGRTNTPAVPATPGAYDETCGNDGACDPSGSFGITQYYGYAERLTTDLSTLIAATYLGASGGINIAVAPSSDVYTIIKSTVTETRLGRMDEYLGSLLGEVVYPLNNTFSALAIGDTSVIAAGSTRDPDLPTTGGVYDPGCGTDGACNPVGATNYLTADVFVARYSLDLQTTQALTYFGGSGTENASAVGLDHAGNIVVTGSVASTDLPASSGAHDSTHNGGDDAFIAKFDSDLSSLIYSSYVGGGDDDSSLSVHAAAGGHVYIAGSTGSSDFPTSTDAYDRTYNGGDVDTFVSLFDTAGGTGGGGGTNMDPIADAGNDQAVGRRARVYLNGGGSSDPDGVISAYQWQQVSGQTVSINNANAVTANFRAPGVRRGRTKVLTFELTVTDDQGATATDQVTVTVSR